SLGPSPKGPKLWLQMKNCQLLEMLTTQSNSFMILVCTINLSPCLIFSSLSCKIKLVFLQTLIRVA
uniref:Uncharacterized protein n=1 Tax=Aegilops tauschii subsp. strangulata TaxID=200361 RepID=A0A453PL37_AEGTS